MRHHNLLHNGLLIAPAADVSSISPHLRAALAGGRREERIPAAANAFLQRGHIRTVHAIISGQRRWLRLEVLAHLSA